MKTLLVLLVLTAAAAADVCKGESPCKACKDCSQCWYCNKSGKGSCSVKREESDRRQREIDARKPKAVR